MGYVYRLFNTKTGLSYIGQTSKTIQKRYRTHCLNANRGHDTPLSQAIREHGADSFEVIELFENSDPNLLLQAERDYVAMYHTNLSQGGSGYNLTSGGQGTPGFCWSLESRERKKITLANLDLFAEDASRLSLADLSSKYEVSVSTIRRFLSEFGIKHIAPKQVICNQHKGSWSIQDENRAIELYLEGKSEAFIATMLDRSTTSIFVKLARLRKKRNMPRMYLKKVKT